MLSIDDSYPIFIPNTGGTPELEKIDAALEVYYNKSTKVERLLNLRASDTHTLKFDLNDIEMAKVCIQKGFWENGSLMRKHSFDKLYEIISDFEKDRLNNTHVVIGSLLVCMVNITEKQYEIFAELIMPSIS